MRISTSLGKITRQSPERFTAQLLTNLLSLYSMRSAYIMLIMFGSQLAMHMRDAKYKFP